MKLFNYKKKLFNTESEFDFNPVKIVKGKDLNYLIKKAQKSKRKRYRFCLHESTNHPTQEMIICFNGFTYIRPHRHSRRKSESYHMIKGSMDVYLFKNNGKVIDIIRLDANKNKKNSIFFYKLSKSIFHTIYPRSKKTIYHEVLTGPFNTKTLIVAKFGPQRDCSKKEALNYFKNLKRQL